IMAMIVVLFPLFLSLFFLPALYLTISFLYRTITLARHSATPGMQLMAIEFRDRSGAKFDLGTAFLHTLGYTLTISTVLLQLLSMGLMLTTARGQGLTDLVLGTVAINKPARN
ncbi:MAG: RDD family protein, partial [Rhodobacter sp.]|nr:RDD family protein [Rhodobacter sp.]